MPRSIWGSAGEINAELGAANGDGDRNFDRFVEAIDENLVPVCAV
jgi:hypothetical protein